MLENSKEIHFFSFYTNRNKTKLKSQTRKTEMKK